jgi:uncharacterized protein YaiE (UPF0345 family)
MSPALSNGVLASGAVIAGWWAWGWQGLLVAASMIVFWLLLQFSRALRVLQHAGRQPVGHVDSAVMLQSRLTHGMSLQEVITLTGSLGTKRGEQDDWQWTDPGGTTVVVHLRRGKVVRWSLARLQEEFAAEQPPDTP